MNGIEARLRLVVGAFELDAELRVPGRGVTAVFGPSGAGKTTLLRCIAGLEPTVVGSLEVSGSRWQDSAAGLFVPTHRRAVGYVFQGGGLFPHLTVRENLRYAIRRRRRARRRVDESSTVAWLGLERLLDRRPEWLSGGEKQRAAIARALLAGPSLLLMDEPLASLDESSRDEILPFLERLHRELSVPAIYVSHSRAEVVRLADHVVLLDSGRVRAVGPIDEISTLAGIDFGPAAEMGTIVEARVVGHEEAFGLTLLEIPGGRISLPAVATAKPGERIRIQLLARDVSLTLVRPERTSILNVLEGRVVEIRDARSTLPLVGVDVSGMLLLARITRKSLVGLDLRPGTAVFAQIKGVALLA